MSGPIPAGCPSCNGAMVAPAACCEACGVEVSGRFGPCAVCRLAGDDLKLFILFLDFRGNLKKVERALGLSYPTVRQKVDDLLTRMGHPRKRPADRMEILRRLREGEITVDEAVRSISLK